MDVVISAIVSWIVNNILNRFFFRARKNEEIIKARERRILERRISEKDRSIAKLRREQKKREKEKYHIIQSLKRSGLSTDKLVERYDKPLNAILISYVTQVRPNKKGYYERYKFIQKELKKYNAKSLGGADALIPPTKMPKGINNRSDLRSWFEEEILKGRYCKLKFLILFDLRKKAFWNSYVPYKQKHPWNFTLGEVLSIEDLFTEEQINKIALSDVIRDGDIAWLASHLLSEKELEIVHKSQSLIEKELGHLSLRLLSNDDIIDKLSIILAKYGIANPDEVSKAIVKEAKFWNSRLQ